MNRQFFSGKTGLVTVIALVVVVAAVVVLIPPIEDSPFQSRFKRLNGADQDPVIQYFRNSGQPAVAFLAWKMKSEDSAVRVKAVAALRHMGPDYTASKAGITALCDALNQSNTDERSIAEGALGDLGPQAKDAVPALIRCVSQGTDINGVWALGRIGPDAKAALPLLESKMRQPTGRERVYAAGAVWEIGGTNAEAKAIVKAARKDADPAVRNDARNVLVECPEIKS